MNGLIAELACPKYSRILKVLLLISPLSASGFNPQTNCQLNDGSQQRRNTPMMISKVFAAFFSFAIDILNRDLFFNLNFRLCGLSRVKSKGLFTGTRLTTCPLSSLLICLNFVRRISIISRTMVEFWSFHF
jgi:hypothetical protein